MPIKQHTNTVVSFSCYLIHYNYKTSTSADWTGFKPSVHYISDITCYKTVVYIAIIMSDIMLSIPLACSAMLLQIAVSVARSIMKPNPPI